MGELAASAHHVMRCHSGRSFISSPVLTRVHFPPAVSSLFLGALPAVVAAWGECADGAAQRGGLHPLPRRGGAGERRRLAPSAAGHQQLGGIRELPQSSAVFRSGSLPGELLGPVAVSHLDFI